ncbi:helix-turn-helix domain-containing protein [Paramicrobacterium chengjingii]|uniref:Helix-turn-helix domain-containing protein n=1 Tax=Paramicrobacterium chengjingii TaxID=2769067 RepID=A0ABX6YL78_9MICO|nr:helix-turn-helix domain-containing protein [Microbacterium chengjingii]QPZ39563.1 helix-turn-helix domain-containing protein [Microbacterium chengjingii]
MTTSTAKTAEEWEQLVSRSFVPLACDTISPDFVGAIDEFKPSPAIKVMRVQSQATIVRRTPRLASRAVSDDIHISLQLRSTGTVHQGEHSMKVRPGTIVLYKTNKPYLLDYSEPNQNQIVVQISRRALGLSARNIDDACARIGVGETGAKHVFASYLTELMKQSIRLGTSEILDMAHVAGELASSMIKSTLSTGRVVPETSRALFVTIQEFIRENAASPALTLDEIAHEHYISRRKLFDLFSEFDHTPASYMRQERLNLAAEALMTNTRPISYIAYSSGFVDVTTFARAFKKQYGCAPRDWRRMVAARDLS